MIKFFLNNLHFENLYSFKPIYSGFVDKDKIVHYGQNRAKFISKGRGLDFKNAVTQIDEYISDPMVQTFKFVFDVMFHFSCTFFAEISISHICETYDEKIPY